MHEWIRVRRVRVLWLAPTFWPARGGIETITAYLARGLRAVGHEICVLTDVGVALDESTVYLDEIPVHRLPIRTALDGVRLPVLLQIQRQMNALAGRFRPDLVHLHLLGPVPIGYFYLRMPALADIPLVITVHDDIAAVRGDRSTVVGQCLDRACWVGVWAQTVLNDVLRWAPELAARAEVIRPGLPSPAVSYRAPSPNPPILLCIGRLSPEKGFDLALEAFAQVRAGYPAAQMVIAGDGLARPGLERLADRLGVRGQVRFTGRVDDTERSRLYSDALAVVMPSRHREGFGLVALEAAQHGRALVAAAAGALSDTATSLGNGMVVAQDDIVALVNAMSQLLAQPDLAQHLGETGYERAVTLYRGEECIMAYAAAYDRCAAARDGAP